MQPNENERLTIGVLAGALIGGALWELTHPKRTVKDQLLSVGAEAIDQLQHRAEDLGDALGAATKRAGKQLKKEQKQALKLAKKARKQTTAAVEQTRERLQDTATSAAESVKDRAHEAGDRGGALLAGLGAALGLAARSAK
ncbi:MAG TPA: hypothetical protein VGE07_08440, partial [Herpetosiphonaceae bacterium]